MEALLGDAAQEVLDIANGPETSDCRMQEICRLHPRLATWKSPRGAKLLGISDVAELQRRLQLKAIANEYNELRSQIAKQSSPELRMSPA